MVFSKNLSTPILNTIWIHKTQKIFIKISVIALGQSLTMWLSSDHVGAVYNSVWSWKQAKNCKICEIEKFLRKIEFLIQSLITYAVILAFHSTKECQTSEVWGSRCTPIWVHFCGFYDSQTLRRYSSIRSVTFFRQISISFCSIFAFFSSKIIVLQSWLAPARRRDIPDVVGTHL